MIRWLEPREPLQSWSASAARPLPAPGALTFDDHTWLDLAANGAAVVNGATGGWLICDEQDRRELLSRAGAVADPAADPVAQLLWRRGLSRIGGTSAIDDGAVAAAIEDTRGHYTLVLLLNAGCNLTCTYCYLGHKQPSRAASMDIETATAALRAAFAQPWPEVLVDLGEISASHRAFGEVAGIARTEADRAGKRVRIAVQTNGTTINAATAAMLSDLDAIVGISLDGPAELHDAARTFRSGAGSHALVMRALDELRTHGVGVHLIATIARHNVHRPLDVVEEIVRHEPVSYLLKPVLAIGEAHDAWDAEGVTPAEHEQFMVTVLRHAADHGGHYLDQSMTKFVARFIGDRNGWRDSCTSRACGSGRSLHVVDSAGGTHACPRFVTTDVPAKPRPVGTAVALQITNRLSAAPAPVSPMLDDLLPASLRTPPPTCAGCPWLASCGGGCTLVGLDPSRPAVPQPDPHCLAYDAMHHEILTRLIPAYLEGRHRTAPAFNGARVRELARVSP